MSGPTETKFKHKHDKPIDTYGPPTVPILRDIFKRIEYEKKKENEKKELRNKEERERIEYEKRELKEKKRERKEEERKEEERKEEERKEEARKEEERKEAARKEAARKEAERKRIEEENKIGEDDERKQQLKEVEDMMNEIAPEVQKEFGKEIADKYLSELKEFMIDNLPYNYTLIRNNKMVISPAEFIIKVISEVEDTQYNSFKDSLDMNLSGGGSRRSHRNKRKVSRKLRKTRKTRKSRKLRKSRKSRKSRKLRKSRKSRKSRK